jgi:hypothetical protein
MTQGTLTVEQKNSILKTQSVLVKIANKQPVFFNITQYVNLGLVKEFGKTFDNKKKWILTEKGKRILNVVL